MCPPGSLRTGERSLLLRTLQFSLSLQFSLPQIGARPWAGPQRRQSRGQGEVKLAAANESRHRGVSLSSGRSLPSPNSPLLSVASGGFLPSFHWHIFPVTLISLECVSGE